MKKLCKLSDKINKKYVKYTYSPTHICKKCGKVANDDDVLCKSEKISKYI